MPRVSRPVAAAGAMLTCPCHAVPLALVLSGTALGTFLLLHLVSVMIGMGAAFLLSIWLLWQTRDSRLERECGSACEVRKPTGEGAQHESILN